jgi:formate hydrogenlyase subunit 6/NADH:ubiquinone oxidoreductase subunit I
MVNPIPQVHEELCTRCGLCVEACLCRSLQMGEQGPVLSCMSESSVVCMENIRCDCLCEEVCPTGAIQCEYEIVSEDPGDTESCNHRSTKSAARHNEGEVK